MNITELLGSATRDLNRRPKRALQIATEVLETSGQPWEATARALVISAAANRLFDDIESAKTMVDRALELYKRFARRIDEQKLHQRALIEMSHVHQWTGQNAQAGEVLDTVLASKEANEDHELYATALRHRALVYNSIGDFVQCIEYLNRCLALSRAHSLKDVEAVAVANIGLFFTHHRDNDSATKILTDALPLLATQEIYTVLSIAENALGNCYDVSGDRARATSHITRAYQIAIETEVPQLILTSGYNTVWLLRHAGKIEESTERLNSLLAIAEHSRTPITRAMAKRTAAGHFFELGQVDRSISLYHEALKIETQNVSERLANYESLYEAYLSLGRTSEALEALQRTLALKEKLLDIQTQRAIGRIEEREAANVETEKRDEVHKRELEEREEQIARISVHLLQKKEFLVSMKRKLSGSAKRQRALIRQIDEQIRAENDRLDFELAMGAQSREFLRRASEKYPDLSPAELKVASLLRLNMPSKAIATLLSTSVRTVEYHRLNLRKKLGLETSEGLMAALNKL